VIREQAPMPGRKRGPAMDHRFDFQANARKI
jgi:hypothetical protein